MRKLLFLALLLLGTSVSEAQDIQLPQPDLSCRTTLMQALQKRSSTRAFSDRDISNAQLSTLLWAACGINRPAEGKITAPSAINAQDIMVIVVRKDGAYRYDPKANTLKQLSTKDLRPAVAGRQTFAAKAPLALLMASDHKKFSKLPPAAASRMGAIDCGYVSQNICLACAALGLGTVPRASMESDTLKKELGLGDDVDLLMNNIVGWPEGK